MDESVREREIYAKRIFDLMKNQVDCWSDLVLAKIPQYDPEDPQPEYVVVGNEMGDGYEYEDKLQRPFYRSEQLTRVARTKRIVTDLGIIGHLIKRRCYTYESEMVQQIVALLPEDITEEDNAELLEVLVKARVEPYFKRHPVYERDI